LKWAFLIAGSILLPASVIGFLLTLYALIAYQQNAFGNLYVSPDMQREKDILVAVSYGFAGTFVASVLSILYGVFSRSSLQSKQAT
jgi:hypothetical protein